MSEIKVIVSADAMQAYLQIELDKTEEIELTSEDVMRVLHAKKISYGINESLIEETLRRETWGKKWLIAEGKPTVHGIDAQIVRLLPANPNSDPGKPMIDEQGNADYKNLGLIHNVRTDEVLAARTPAVDGKVGVNVYGQELAYIKGREFSLPKGKNTYTNEENTKLFALIDGQARVASNLIAVEPIYQINGDVDYETGNIDFVGNVVVRGNVTSGFEVKAQGNIEIAGYVESAQVISGGDIRVTGGIKTGIKGSVKAKGSVFSKFIENSRIEAGEDIIVKEAVIQSELAAGRDVKVTDNKATIVGGLTQAGGAVAARVIGSPLATQTMFEVGVNPTLKAKYYVLVKELEKVKEDITGVDGNIKVIQNSGVKIEQLSPQRKQMLLDFIGKYK
jgi:uncharacterized protein (DUF342 family)